MLLCLSFFAIAVTSDLERESQLQTPSGTLERWTNLQDEREFGVRLVMADGESIWLEEAKPAKDLSSTLRRQVSNMLMGGASSEEEVVLVDHTGREKILGYADRNFEIDCSALSHT